MVKPRTHFVDDAYAREAWGPVVPQVNAGSMTMAFSMPGRCHGGPWRDRRSCFHAVTEMRVAPFQVADDLFARHRAGVCSPAMSFGRIVRTMEAVSVEESGARLGQVAVPDLIGLLLNAHAVQFAAAGLIEQTELDHFCVFRE